MDDGNTPVWFEFDFLDTDHAVNKKNITLRLHLVPRVGEVILFKDSVIWDILDEWELPYQYRVKEVFHLVKSKGGSVSDLSSLCLVLTQL